MTLPRSLPPVNVNCFPAQIPDFASIKVPATRRRTGIPVFAEQFKLLKQ
jgi:hypothetical protein